VRGAKKRFSFAKTPNQNILFSPASAPLPKLLERIAGK
jgi:hypothetical protein